MYFSPAVSGFVIALVLLKALVRTPLAHKLYDQSLWSSEKIRVPVIGGICIFVGLVFSDSIYGFDELFSYTLYAGGFLVLLGMLDDKWGLSIRVRLFAQFVVTGFGILVAGVHITDFGVWHPNSVDFPIWISVPLTLLVVVGLTNTFNLSDGLDGLCAGYFLIAIINLVLVIFLWDIKFGLAVELASIFGIVFGFWLVNIGALTGARLFLGDAGSLFLGFLIAWVLIFATQVGSVEPTAALWSVTLPVFDTFLVITTRLLNKKSPFLKDRNHCHYILVDLGLSPEKCVKTLLLTALFFSLFGAFISTHVSPSGVLVFYVLFLTSFVLAFIEPAKIKCLLTFIRILD